MLIFLQFWTEIQMNTFYTWTVNVLNVYYMVVVTTSPFVCDGESFTECKNVIYNHKWKLVITGVASWKSGALGKRKAELIEPVH